MCQINMPHVQPEKNQWTKCKTIHVKMSFIFMRIKLVFISMASHLASLWNRGLVQQNTGNLIDLIHDTRHLCTRLRTDGIKVTSRACFLRGQASDKICQCKKSRSSLFVLYNRKWRTFYLKDDNGKLWVKVIIRAIYTRKNKTRLT